MATVDQITPLSTYITIGALISHTAKQVPVINKFIRFNIFSNVLSMGNSQTEPAQ